MTSVSFRRGVAPPPVVVRWRDLPAHAVMLGVMLLTMVGGPSVIRDLAGVGILAVTAIACARTARDDEVFRAHLVDFAGMALLLVACLHAHRGTGIHDHFALPAGPAVVVVALVGWTVGRVTLLRRMRSGRRAAMISATVAAIGLALMTALCGFGN